MAMWKNEEYDMLMQEVVRCDKVIHNSQKSFNDEHHIVRIFTNLMPQGKVCAAVRWVTERSRSGILQPAGFIERMDGKGRVVKTPVIDILHIKHPESRLPSKEALTKCKELLLLEEV